MLLEFIHWNVDPAIFHIGSFGIRYYSLGFLFAFVLGYYIMFRMFKREKLETDKLDSLVIWMFLSVLIGARLGHCLFYEPDYFLTAEHWPEIFLPIQLSTGRFVGYQGLASHGAAIAVLLAIWLFCRKYKFNGWWLLDRLVIVVALGGAFIRLGNLFNSEIYGDVTPLPWGIVFERNGETLPKHPTQLYEALSYTILGAGLLWAYNKKLEKLKRGEIFGIFLICLFGVRFLIEFIKEPQVEFETSMALNMGQLLSIPFIIAGVALLVWSLTKGGPAMIVQPEKPKKEPTHYAKSLKN